MKTIKLNISHYIDIIPDMRKFNSIMHVAFNRFKEGMSEKEARMYCKRLFTANSWFMQCAIREASALYRRNKDSSVVFGGRQNLKDYLSGKISKSTYRYRKLIPICLQGECRFHGNRLVDFDLNKRSIVYKVNKSAPIFIGFHEPKKNITNELELLQQLIEANGITVTVRITDKNLWLIYDESKLPREKFKHLNRNRILGIDMNPGCIGLSVIEFNADDTFDVLHKQVYDLSKLTIVGGTTHYSTPRKRTNKLNYETIHIAHDIDNMVNTWKCSIIAIENLSMVSGKDFHNKTIFKLCEFDWKRNLFTDKLMMLSREHGYAICKVMPQYSSIVGNFAYGNTYTPDMVAASIEIARRARKPFSKEWFLPTFHVSMPTKQWKHELAGVNTWKELFSKVKESGLKYRFLLKDSIPNAVFSKFDAKRQVKTIAFPC